MPKYRLSLETRKKLSENRKGKVSPAKGKTWKLSAETKMKQRLKKLGSNHWNWQGGISKVSARIRRTFLYRQWRNDVFIRDDFSCVLCFRKGVYLEADHSPKLFSEILKEYKIDSVEKALECSELWNIENGRTLCRECHKAHGRKH